MSEKKVSFLPFHAINEFMRDDFRQAVVQSVLHQSANLSDDRRKQLQKLTQKYVKIAGFRNSSAAPAGVRLRPTCAAFEKHPDLVSTVLAAWAELNPILRENVYQLLKERSWELLPADADRSVLPGFLSTWPKGEDFDLINQAYTEKYPDSASNNSDKVSLMVVWLSDRLPVDKGEEEEKEETN